ncbi:hypothetical protein [Ancylobacter oerskovii]|uniref:Class I SAM-dependent methyltransferase n=1 Tax=Ancylobacter oerskovii TaxID=459519 RepID=A0ABW4YUH6_9HYPH|nr:hypothetical protein [Ancylobacter oerskovii]MBS7543651.1 hypothetical protein [Ancylobacter oerskovii]
MNLPNQSPHEHEATAAVGTEAAAPTLGPTLSPAELDLLMRHARAARGIIEYGCGHSTGEFVRAGAARILSVDSDPAWIARLRLVPALAEAEAEGRLAFIHVDLGPVKNWGKPKDKSLKGRWPAYAPAPWVQAPDFAPDLVFVDGRFRVASILAALLFGPPGVTVAVHDFWNRPEYHPVLRFAAVLERAETLAVLRAAPRLNRRALATALRPALADPR